MPDFKFEEKIVKVVNSFQFISRIMENKDGN